MKHSLRLLMASICLLAAPLSAQTYLSSYPYISGNTFRAFCAFKFDVYESFDPQDVQDADTVFVNTSMLATFFTTMHPAIQCPYILVTHNNDAAIPGAYVHYLDDEKIVAWFGQNADPSSHQKVFHLPIGMANMEHSYGNITSMTAAITKSHALTKNNDPKKLLYMNFKRSEKRGNRSEIFKLFYKKDFCTYAERKEYPQYLAEMATFKCVLSPEGFGMDCYRTWEALLVGCIPVIKSCPLNSMFEDLPVIIVNDWKQVNKTFLEKKYKELTHPSKQYNFEKLFIDYWLKKIQDVQDTFRTQHAC